MDVPTLERNLTGSITKEMSNVIETVEDRIQNAILTAMDPVITPRIELAVNLMNTFSARDWSVTANSEYGEEVWISAPYGNVSERKSTFRELNITNET